MAKRRGSGEGSIHQLPSGSWRAQVTVEGRRISHTAPTRKDAQEWVRQTTGQVDAGLTYEATRTTVEAFLAGWLASVKASLRPNTHAQYTRIARSHILPHIGKIKLSQLRPDHVQALYDRALLDGTGVRTVAYIHSVLHKALNHALRMGVVMRNVCDAAAPPRRERHEITPLSEEEVGRLLSAIEGHRLKALFYLAIVTGMREGELLGLQWGDLDWQAGTIAVRRQAQAVRGQGVRFVPPKTEAGRRTVLVGSQMLELLRAQYEQVRLLRLAAGDKWKENDLIFPTLAGTPFPAPTFNRQWQKVEAAAALPPTRFHDLRHLAASILLVKLKRPPTEVAAILGHSKTSITLDIYGHMLGGMSQETARAIEEQVFPVQLHTIAHAHRPEDKK